ncbi:putative disease resistance protein At4g19050 [Carica papaya]|uniref:putative disease resistance protein At4g19050 n=1 Tax=Carica papaya TaxID=3649 RepID=UPI000B8C98FC|nr:putative disease resistance protein At4g19050 [Carica papaya]XP_021902188.1 putative disease resistance protein At4g19050 [Carica papaya]XP_021902189.1 putative disease resistance protein At4g19050 [Carica papaya]XP_021902190.1 putative disease resistance protein At4g19050 [Carica papaya]XP_021902191.1 putative disease resistance protein At4g19050 [Carica papaya]
MDNGDTLDLRVRFILKELCDDHVKVVCLVGKPGIGKTWTAKKVHDIVKQESQFDLCFWLSMSRKHDKESPLERIAAQLPICLPTEEWDADDDGDDDEYEEMQAEANLKKKISAATDKKRCLLILDGFCKGVEVYETVSEFESLVPDFKQPSFKVLVTTIDYSGKPNGPYAKVLEIEPLSATETINLLQEKVRDPDFKLLFRGIHEESEGNPAKIEAMAEALNYIMEYKHRASREKFGAVATITDASSIIPCFLQIAHAVMPTNDLIHCFWHSWQYIHMNGPVNFTQLIAHWIMEGCLGPIDCIEDAFKKGYSVLVDLINLGFLRHVESNCVVMVGCAMKLPCWWIRGLEDYLIYEKNRDGGHYSGTDFQRFIDTESCSMIPALEDKMWEGFGDIAVIDGVIRTVGYSSKSEKISTLLLDGNCLGKEDPDAFFHRLNGLSVLGIFNPMLKSLPASFSHMQELTMLILRGCEFLENINQIQGLKSLVTLEISGAISLTTIPDDFLQHMLQLQSLNFCGARVERLPISISNLTELRWLILRGCRHLKMLPRLSALKKLEVIDLNGASCFEKFYDKTFYQLPKLKILDVSHSQIDRLPILSGLEELTQLVLRNCKSLTRLSRIKGLSNLQVLDLSGAICLKEIYDDISPSLKVLDLSKTDLYAYPSITCNISHILLRNCTRLTKLPSTEACRDLEFLDVSGSSNVVEIEDQSFQHLGCLRCLNLSDTEVRSLPSLSHLPNLHTIILRECKFLEHLPEMEGLARLEVLDLTNARSLTGFDYSQFPNMRQLILRGCSSLSRLPAVPKNLEVIDLSGCTDLSLHGEYSHTLLGLSQLRILRLCGIRDVYFPIIGSLSNLEELNISNIRYPPLGKLYLMSDLLSYMRNLRILNLSKTPIYIDVFFLTNLTQLSLRGWSHIEDTSGLEKLTRLEVLDLSETPVKRLPSLKFLCNLCRLLLRDCWCLKKLQHLESLSHLEVLDLWGTGIKEFPYEISDLPCLKQLHLPLLEDTEELDWRRIKRLPEELNWVDCGIFGAAKVFPLGVSNLHIMVHGSKFFEFLDKNPILWDKYFKQFHFSVFPPRKHGEDGDFFSHRDEAKYRDIYTRTRCFPSYLEIHRQSLEIRSCCPFLGLEGVLKRAQYICLRDNANISWLSELGAKNISAMRGCCIERCSNMESVFSREEEAVGVSNKIETLQILNLPNLKSICNNNLQVERFRNLKHLYLECCPLLEIVFSLSRQPMNLRTLEIRFCDNLKRVFEFDGTTVSSMKHLRTLHLFELPELKSIGAALPSLERLTGGECPKLDVFFTCFFIFVWAIQNWSMTLISAVEEQSDDSQACLGLPKFPPRIKHIASQKTNEITQE